MEQVATQLVNLTPHPLKVLEGDVVALELPKPAADVALPRVASTQEKVGEADGVTLFRQVFGEVDNLPEEKEGVLYIVSALVRTAAPDRKDLTSPGQLVRDSEGNPIGCQGLAIN